MMLKQRGKTEQNENKERSIDRFFSPSFAFSYATWRFQILSDIFRRFHTLSYTFIWIHIFIFIFMYECFLIYFHTDLYTKIEFISAFKVGHIRMLKTVVCVNSECVLFFRVRKQPANSSESQPMRKKEDFLS